jgi:hypothetical protein
MWKRWERNMAEQKERRQGYDSDKGGKRKTKDEWLRHGKNHSF